MEEATKIKSVKGFNEYLKEREVQVRNEATDGYYHVNVVADAYIKGIEDGKKLGKEELLKNMSEAFVETFVKKANKIYLLSKDTVKYLKNEGYKVESLHINISSTSPKVILTISNKTLVDDNFVKKGYRKLAESKKEYLSIYDEMLDIAFVGNKYLDRELLKEDGFEYFEIYNG
ncbi:MAG: hypothetical protein HN704_11845 [Bacteroidetes bacterium]|jgi:hypothetical protein|nr:hypothetical protein [Bacteroidota bacterium]MBT6685574.1 hypothetical protein [Bacteroidota bacterium]MBT7144462.1 hypothetical protein [Bacteroidota bacterium]MBT7492284.1 hypothetical protein [Bacteroidota bacterium]